MFNNGSGVVGRNERGYRVPRRLPTQSLLHCQVHFTMNACCQLGAHFLVYYENACEQTDKAIAVQLLFRYCSNNYLITIS